MRYFPAFALGLCLLATALAQDAPPKKKRGFLDRLNDKLDKINQKLDPNAPKTAPPDEPKAAPETRDKPTPQASRNARPDRKGVCRQMNWKYNPLPDPANELPTDWSVEGTYFAPEPVEPEGTFTLEQLGQTRTIRAIFPPRMGKQLFSQKGKRKINAYRDASPPFEAEFSFEDGLLRTAYCDENGVYHDSGIAMEAVNPTGVPGKLSIDLERFVKRGGWHMGGWREFQCNDCYFINQVFSLGIEDSKIVVLVNPSPLRYYYIRVAPFAATLTVPPTAELCTLSRPAFPCDPAPFEAFQRTVEPAYEELFPGAKTNVWYAKCKTERCDQRQLTSLAERIQASTSFAAR